MYVLIMGVLHDVQGKYDDYIPQSNPITLPIY